MIRFLISILIMFLLGLFVAANAEMIKCKMKEEDKLSTGYFDSKDKNISRKCIGKKTIVKLNINRESKKEQFLPTVGISTKRHYQKTYAKKISKCGGSGGTVKVNGKIFHLDKDELCKKYGAKGKGSVKNGVPEKFNFANVDVNIRNKMSNFINKTAIKYTMDPAFVHAIISVESSYKINAKSSVGAAGLMQLMPFTAERFGVLDVYNPYQNVEAGVKYLKLLYNEFGALELVAAGYNAGEGTIRKYKGIPPYRETMAYVPKVMAFYDYYKKNKSLIFVN